MTQCASEDEMMNDPLGMDEHRKEGNTRNTRTGTGKDRKLGLNSSCYCSNWDKREMRGN